MTPKQYNAELIRAVLDSWPQSQLDIESWVMDNWPGERGADAYVQHLISSLAVPRKGDPWQWASTAHGLLKEEARYYFESPHDAPPSLVKWSLGAVGSESKGKDKQGRHPKTLKDIKTLWLSDKIQRELTVSKHKSAGMIADAIVQDIQKETGADTRKGVLVALKKGEKYRRQTPGAVVLHLLDLMYWGYHFRRK